MSEIEEWDTCPDCSGFGNLEESQPQRDDPDFCVIHECPNCNGTGYVQTGFRLVADDE